VLIGLGLMSGTAHQNDMVRREGRRGGGGKGQMTGIDIKFNNNSYLIGGKKPSNLI